MSDLDELTAAILKFRDQRDWKQFHSVRNLAESLVLEAAEVLEHFQWKNEKEIKAHLKKHKIEFAHELADVFNYLLLLANEAGVDLMKATKNKIKVNEKKYPISQSRGRSTKYNRLRR